MKFLAGDLDSRHLFITHLLLCRIYSFIQCSFDFQSLLGCRRAYEIDDHFSAQQGASPPIVRDLGKETVLDLVPFACAGRKVPEVDFKAGCRGQFLQTFLP